MITLEPHRAAIRPATFDVLCAGVPVWTAARDARGLSSAGASAGLFRVARMLARAAVPVGLAAVLEDDRRGRTSVAELASLGVDVGGVRLSAPASGLLVVDAAGGLSARVSDGAPELEVPPSWSSRVLLLSGISGITSRLAALCKAARRAQREGSVVVLDLVGGLRHWAGRDPRVLSSLLREADVVRGSYVELATLGADAATVRARTRQSATVIVHDEAGARVTGTFGEVRVTVLRAQSPQVVAEALTAAVCAELARPRRGAETPAGRWHRVLTDEAERLALSAAS